jgi:phosphate-selective porin OprO and OprP
MIMRLSTKIFPVLLAVALLPAALAAQEPSTPPAVTASKAFKLTGYTQILYTSSEEAIDGLSIRRARFSLAAELLKNVRFKAQLDLVKSPVLIDAQVEFILHEAASFRVGQFKVPFSLELTTSSAELDTINRSQPVNKLAPSLDIGGGGRDVGAVVFGKAAFLEYTFGLFNGAGANKADTNDRKDLAGRLVVHPLPFLSVGASFYDGSYAASAGAPSTVRDRVGADVAVLQGSASLKADFIQAEDGDTLRRGWYVQGGYFFLPKTLQGIVKLDSYDPDGSASGDRLGTWTLGLNWFLTDKTKLQVNAEIMRNEAGATVGKSLLIQLQGGF